MRQIVCKTFFLYLFFFFVEKCLVKFIGQFDINNYLNREDNEKETKGHIIIFMC